MSAAEKGSNKQEDRSQKSEQSKKQIFGRIKIEAEKWKSQLEKKLKQQKDGEVDQKLQELIQLCDFQSIQKKKAEQNHRKEEEQKFKKQEQQRQRLQQQRKKQEEERKRQEQEKRRKEEQQRKKKQQQLKRLRMKQEFKQKNQSVLKRIQQAFKNLQELHNIDPNLRLQQAITLITNVKTKIKQIQQKAKQIEIDMLAICNLGKTIDQQPSFQQPFKQLVHKIAQQNTRYDELQNAAFIQDRQKTKEQRSKNLQTYSLPKNSIPYQKSNFYQLSLANLYEQELHKLKQKKLENDIYEYEKQKLQDRFKILKIKQKYINEIKILIELSQLKPQQLQYHHFDLPNFQDLIVKKSKLVNQISHENKLLANMEDFNKIEQQLGNILNKLNTQEFLVPYRYPSDILVKTKQDLVIDYYNKLCVNLSKQLQQQEEKTKTLQKRYSELSKQQKIKHEKLEKAKEKYQNFIEKQQTNIKKALLIQEDNKEDILPRQLKEPNKQQLKIKVTNLNQLKEFYTALFKQSPSKQFVQTYDERKVQKKRLEEQYINLSDRFLRSPLKIDDYLVKKALPQSQQQSREDEKQLDRLKKLCETIEKAKRLKQSKFNGSKIELYSSVLG